MKNLMKQMVAGGAVVIALAASGTLAYAKEKGVSGSWTLSAEGYVLKLDLVQSGTKISGTLHGPHRPMPLKGQFAKGRITFSGGGPDGVGGKEEFSAAGVLQSDGALVGDLTSSTSQTDLEGRADGGLKNRFHHGLLESASRDQRPITSD